jgi:hypothetical protein
VSSQNLPLSPTQFHLGLCCELDHLKCLVSVKEEKEEDEAARLRGCEAEAEVGDLRQGARVKWWRPHTNAGMRTGPDSLLSTHTSMQR